MPRPRCSFRRQWSTCQYWHSQPLDVIRIYCHVIISTHLLTSYRGSSSLAFTLRPAWLPGSTSTPRIMPVDSEVFDSGPCINLWLAIFSTSEWGAYLQRACNGLSVLPCTEACGFAFDWSFSSVKWKLLIAVSGVWSRRVPVPISASRKAITSGLHHGIIISSSDVMKHSLVKKSMSMSNTTIQTSHMM